MTLSVCVCVCVCVRCCQGLPVLMVMVGLKDVCLLLVLYCRRAPNDARHVPHLAVHLTRSGHSVCVCLWAQCLFAVVCNYVCMCMCVCVCTAVLMSIFFTADAVALLLWCCCWTSLALCTYRKAPSRPWSCFFLDCRVGLTRIFTLSAFVVPVCHVHRVCLCVCVCLLEAPPTPLCFCPPLAPIFCSTVCCTSALPPALQLVHPLAMRMRACVLGLWELSIGSQGGR